MSEQEMIRILIADDHPILRQGLQSLLRERYGMHIIGEAVNGLEVVQLNRQLQPDIILMDLFMPEKNGLEATREIIEEYPDARILLLTSFVDDDRIVEAIKAGACGCVLKDSAPELLIAAIHKVFDGDLFLPQNITRKLVLQLGQPEDKKGRKESGVALSEREMDVARLVGRGLSNKAIAEKLCLSPVTVRFHVSNILQKFQFENRTQVASYVIQHGWLDEE